MGGFFEVAGFAWWGVAVIVFACLMCIKLAIKAKW